MAARTVLVLEAKGARPGQEGPHVAAAVTAVCVLLTAAMLLLLLFLLLCMSMCVRLVELMSVANCGPHLDAAVDGARHTKNSKTANSTYRS